MSGLNNKAISMDSSKLTVHGLYRISVWDTYGSPAGWRKLPAVFLGETDGIASFLTHVRGDDHTHNLDDTLTEHTLAVDHWAVFSDRAEFIAEKADCLHFANTLGTRKKSHMPGSTQGQQFAEIARQAGLPTTRQPA